MAREVVVIVLAGRERSLPVTMTEADQLTRMGLCPYQRASEAAQQGKPLGLAFTHACDILTVGMRAAGEKVTRQELWDQGRGRKHGVRETVDAALAYWMTFVTSTHDPESEPLPEVSADPKA